MDGLIKVDFSADRLTVSARDLHGFLEVKTAFKDWFPRMCEYGFTEGADFNPLKIERVQTEGGRKVTREVPDAALTIDMAKEICMLQRNEKGKQARQYFIQLEKDWNSPEKVMARALKIADVKIKGLEADNAALQAKIAADAPKVRYAESVEGADNGTLVREFAKFLRENGVDTGEKRLYEDLRRRGFLIRAEGRDRNSPTQRAMDMGLFTVKETIVQTPQGGKTRTTPLLTGKGKVYFMSLYLRERDAAANPAPVAEAEA